MSLKDLRLLLANLDEIATRVEQLSPSLQDVAFSALVDALLQPDQSLGNVCLTAPDAPESQDQDRLETHEFDQDKTMCNYYQKYGLEYISDMEFATFVAYFHSHILPPESRIQAISSRHYEHACRITGRRMPGSVGGTLNNALNLKSYLERRGTGLYSLADAGSEYIMTTLIREKK